MLLDTSVIVAAFTPDPHSEKAERYLNAPEHFLVSDWAAAEFSAAIRNKVRQGLVRNDGVKAVETAFDDWTRRLGGRQRLSPDDTPLARRLVVTHPLLRAPDALHIAIAMRLSAALATFDDRQSAAAVLEAVPRFAP